MLNSGNPLQKGLIPVYIIILLFLMLILRLWQLQILQGTDYRRLSEENRLRIVRVAAPRGIIYDRNNISLVKNTAYYSVSISPLTLDRINIPALSVALKMDIGALSERLNHSRSLYEPVRLMEGLSPSEVAFIEARRSDFPGLSIDVDVSREYLFGSAGAHLIGYLGKPTLSQSENPEFRHVPQEAFIGQWGVEKIYDRELRGTAGERIIEVNAAGRELRLIQEKAAIRGRDITLAMDINLQKEADEAFGDKVGAFVALKPETGEVLALTSRPSFDPNIFATGISSRQWEGLIKNGRQPLMNRALQSQFPPGSTFKIVTAIAALEEGVITPDTKVTCRGEIVYGKWHFGCWQKKGHGTLSLHRALVESCDVFFYEAGKKLGIDKIASYARELGLGNKTGLLLAKERNGLIPDTVWKQEKRKQSWYLGETFNAAIGQGYVAATPLQMAQLMGIVSNGGSVYTPSLLYLKEKPEPVRRLKLKPETLSIINSALLGVVNEEGGTGKNARSLVAKVSGKTGTAQVVGLRKESKYLSAAHKDHAWFVSFAPYEKAEIAMAVMVEHGGHGGVAAAPIAKRAVEAYIKSSRTLVNSASGDRQPEVSDKQAEHRGPIQ